MAIVYARRHQRSYTSVIWLSATSQLILDPSVRPVAYRLVMPEWLSYPRITPWLLIIDNQDDPGQYDLESFYPNTGQGSVLVTVRLPDLMSDSNSDGLCAR